MKIFIVVKEVNGLDVFIGCFKEYETAKLYLSYFPDHKIIESLAL